MLFDHLNEDNFLLFAIKNYENPQAVTKEDFDKDLNHFKYIKRLLKRYKNTGVLKTHLLLNHFIVLYNIFGEAATPMLFFKIEYPNILRLTCTIFKLILTVSLNSMRSIRKIMEKRILNKILNFIREEGPTMTSGSNPQGFSSAADSKGPVAGFDPVMGKPQKRKKTIIYLKGARKNWKK